MTWTGPSLHNSPTGSHSSLGLLILPRVRAVGTTKRLSRCHVARDKVPRKGSPLIHFLLLHLKVDNGMGWVPTYSGPCKPECRAGSGSPSKSRNGKGRVTHQHKSYHPTEPWGHRQGPHVPLKMARGAHLLLGGRRWTGPGRHPSGTQRVWLPPGFRSQDRSSANRHCLRLRGTGWKGTQVSTENGHQPGWPDNMGNPTPHSKDPVPPEAWPSDNGLGQSQLCPGCPLNASHQGTEPAAM